MNAEFTDDMLAIAEQVSRRLEQVRCTHCGKMDASVRPAYLQSRYKPNGVRFEWCPVLMICDACMDYCSTRQRENPDG